MALVTFGNNSAGNARPSRFIVLDYLDITTKVIPRLGSSFGAPAPRDQVAEGAARSLLLPLPGWRDRGVQLETLDVVGRVVVGVDRPAL